MKIEYITINGKKHPLCCGIYLLAEFQKKYDNLEAFSTVMTGGKGEEPDYSVVLEVFEKMNACGAKAIGTEPLTREEIENADPYDVLEKVFKTYLNSLMPESPEGQSQTKQETD